MATNPYFRKAVPSEQDLIDDLAIEVIKINGFDMIYLPRTIIERDDILGEDSKVTEFNSGHEIEMLVESVDGFEGDGEIFGRLGLQIKDSITLLVARRRFEEEFEKKGFKTPREGDLLYFPISGAIFEIDFVERENPFYQLNQISTYKMTCSMFRYSGEVFNTGWQVIDAINEQYIKRTQNVTLGAGDGSYVEGETVYQGASIGDATMTARVENWDPNTKVLEISNIVGSFDETKNIVGELSGSSYDPSTIVESDNVVVDENIGDNLEFEEEANEIFDFSELDPFSEGDL